MDAVEIQDHARRLKAAHGDGAVAEAAQKAAALEKAGDAQQAKDWRRIEAALRQMQGPHSS